MEAEDPGAAVHLFVLRQLAATLSTNYRERHRHWNSIRPQARLLKQTAGSARVTAQTNNTGRG